MMVQINDLPEEVLENILFFVSPYEDLKSCRLVCQRWYGTCLGVVKKRKTKFTQALKNGRVQWFTPNISTNPNSITRRYSHSACIYDSYMYVFGGCTATNTTFNDLWLFNLGTHEWTRLLTTGTYPSPKAYSSMITWNNNLILFGGWTHPSVYPLHQQSVLFNELHIYNIVSNRWTQLYYDGCPPPTAGHTSTVHNNIVVVFGGLQRQDGSSSSTNDIYCLNLEKELWFKPNVTSNKPQPRYGHSQIKIDEWHLLIMAGCGGSNKLYSDVWLLTLPENFSENIEEWKWAPINVEGLENIPTQMWYNPACKIGDQVVVLSTWQYQNSSPGTKSGKMSQLFMPSSIRKQSTNMVWVSPENNLPQEQHLFELPSQDDNMEINVNGQRGSLRPIAHCGDASTSSESEDNADSSSAKSRAKPSIRPNASSDRERRLEMLSRMELRIKQFRKQSNFSNKAGSSKITSSNIIDSTICLVPHILDITMVISTQTVSWQPVSLNNDGYPPYIGMPPQPCLLYTLLMGRGHLIMFGGIPNNPTGSQNHEAVSNDVTFLLPPSLSNSTV